MANANELARLRRSVRGWNSWRQKERGPFTIPPRKKGPDLAHANLRGLDLTGADLGGVDLQSCDLRKANLHKANLRAATLYGADLRGVKAKWADISQAELGGANLAGGNFDGVDFRNSHVDNVNMRAANLKHADLRGTYFTRTDLTKADCSSALLLSTVFGDCTLRTVRGLSACIHEGPSFIDYHTLTRSGRLPVPFLRECGLGNRYISALPTLLREQAPLRCFISYSVKDEQLVERLDSDLGDRDVRCWYFRKDAVAGRVLPDEIKGEIERCDKLILVCSQTALNSVQVLKEIDLAMLREKNTSQQILVPVRVDEYAFGAWTDRRKKTIVNRTIGDFRGWRKDRQRYEKGLEALFNALYEGNPPAHEAPGA
jgi:TIR domain/Pentapeptide repeats (8 copies)